MVEMRSLRVSRKTSSRIVDLPSGNPAPLGSAALSLGNTTPLGTQFLEVHSARSDNPTMVSSRRGGRMADASPR